jgi:hypothetical protein
MEIELARVVRVHNCTRGIAGRRLIASCGQAPYDVTRFWAEMPKRFSHNDVRVLLSQEGLYEPFWDLWNSDGVKSCREWDGHNHRDRVERYIAGCRDKAFALLSNPRFCYWFEVSVFNGEVSLREDRHDSTWSEFSLSEFIEEWGKRIFRARFPEHLRGEATRLYYSLGAFRQFKRL